MFNENFLSEGDKASIIKLKKIMAALASVFLAVLVIFFIAKSFNEIEQRKYIGQDIIPVNTITVSGKGEIFTKPDIAKISISVEKEALSVAEAQNKATEDINKIIAFLKGSSIEDKDIKTTNYNIYPRYDYLEEQGRVFRGYTVTQTLEIKIRKIDETGKILSGAALAGANQVGGIYFTVDDEEAPKREARQKAIIDAKEKSDQLAKDLGVKIVRLVSFYESGGDSPYLYNLKAAGFGMGGEAAPAPEIPAGENKITTTVSLTYEIK